MAKRKLTKKEVEQLEETFWYEVGTLISQGLLYLRRGEEFAADIKKYPYGDPAAMYPVADALFDSLLTKLRALDSFFQNIGDWDTDGIAKDLGAWKKREMLPKDVRRRINVRIAHITTLRPKAHHWEIGKLVHAALLMIANYMDEVGVAGRHKWKERRSEVAAVLAAWADLDDVVTENDRHAHR